MGMVPTNMKILDKPEEETNSYTAGPTMRHSSIGTEQIQKDNPAKFIISTDDNTRFVTGN